MERELLGTYPSENHRQFADNLLRTHRGFSEKYFKIFVMVLFDSCKIELRVIFHQFSGKCSHNSPRIFRQLYGGYALKFSVLSFCADLIFRMDLTIG